MAADVGGMPVATTFPPFTRLPFTRTQARAVGISDTALQSRQLKRLFKGVYILNSVEMTFRLWLLAALLAMPPNSVISHVTALRLYGFSVGDEDEEPLHVSTRSVTHTRREGITAHQRQARISSTFIHGVEVTSPLRTLIDIATKVNLVELIQAIEFMIHRGHATLGDLNDYAHRHHLHGVQKVRRILVLVREESESPMETFVRLMLVFARLPEPAGNMNLYDDVGTFLARGDLVYAAYFVLVEYDGQHHERTASQRRKDIHRRERLEAAGWTVIVVTSGDLTRPHSIVRRVHQALTARGYLGPAPTFSIMWKTWFVPKTKTPGTTLGFAGTTSGGGRAAEREDIGEIQSARRPA